MENKIEEYAGFIILFCIFTFFVGFTFYAVNRFSIKERLSMNEIILFWTMVVLIWYTWETSKLRKAAQKQVTEAQKQTDIQQRPFVVVEPVLDHSMTQFEKFRIRNIGNNPAINIGFEPVEKIKCNFPINFLLSNCCIDVRIVPSPNMSADHLCKLFKTFEEQSTSTESEKYIIFIDRSYVSNEITFTMKYSNVENAEYYTTQKLGLHDIKIIRSEKVMM